MRENRVRRAALRSLHEHLEQSGLAGAYQLAKLVLIPVAVRVRAEAVPAVVAERSGQAWLDVHACAGARLSRGVRASRTLASPPPDGVGDPGGSSHALRDPRTDGVQTA
jgi:hypothetical protein